MTTIEIRMAEMPLTQEERDYFLLGTYTPSNLSETYFFKEEVCTFIEKAVEHTETVNEVEETFTDDLLWIVYRAETLTGIQNFIPINVKYI